MPALVCSLFSLQSSCYSFLPSSLLLTLQYKVIFLHLHVFYCYSMLAVQVILEVVALATPFAFMLVYLYYTLSIMLVVFQSVHSRLLPQVYVINSRWCFFLVRPEKIFISILDNTSFLKEFLPLLDNFSLLCYLRGLR